MNSCRFILAQWNNIARLKTHKFGHARRMLISQVSINFHCQRAAVFVTQPTRYGRNVHAAFDAPRGKQVAQIVVSQMSYARFLFRAHHCQFTLHHPHNTSCRRFVRALLPQFFQKLAHLRNHGNAADFTIFRPFFGIATHDNLVALKITVSPSNVFGFTQAKTAICEEANQISAIFAESSTRIFNLLHKLDESFVVRANATLLA